MLFDGSDRPDWAVYWMKVAEVIKTRSNCCRRQVGSVLTTNDNDIITVGYNGTARSTKNCFDGGCARCNDTVPSGVGYDQCICTHSEANAFIMAARQGKSTKYGVLYVTIAPCILCVKELIQAGVERIIHGGNVIPMDLTIDQRGMIMDSHIIIERLNEDGTIELDSKYYL